MSTSVLPDKTHQTDIQAEADFVNSFATRLESGETGADRGRVKAERELKKDVVAPAKAEKKPDESTDTPKADKAATDTSPTKVAPSGDSTVTTAEGDAEGTTTESGTEKPAVEKKPEDEPEKGQEKKEKEAVETVDDDDDDVDVDDLDDSELAQEAKTQLAKHGIKMTLDDLPKEARPMVQRALDGMKAGYTRAMMEQRQYRKEETQFHAARSYMQEHPEMVIFDLLHTGKDGALNEELFTRLNTMMEEAGTETGRKSLAIITKDARGQAIQKVEEQRNAREALNRRGDEIDTYVRRACTSLNLPYESVVEAVVNRMYEKPDDARDLSEQEIDAVIGRQRRILARFTGTKKQEQKKEEIKARTQDKKITSPAAKATTGGTAAAPSGEKQPANDADFIAKMVAQRSGSR